MKTNKHLSKIIDDAICLASSMSDVETDQWAKCVEELFKAKATLKNDAEIKSCKHFCGMDFENRCLLCGGYR